jgi:hypothetical protein
MSISTQNRLQERQNRSRQPEAVQALLQSLPKAPVQTPLSFLEIGTGYRPGRSSGLSIAVHLIAYGFVLISTSHFVHVQAAEVVPPRFAPMKVDPLYLPVLGGGSEGGGQIGGGSGNTGEASSGLRAKSRRGFAYAGLQPLVSAPPMAKLGIQTILRPSLKNAPMLHQNFVLPNLAIAPAPPPADLPKPVMKVESGRVAIRQVEKPIQAPKLKIPAASISSMPQLSDAEPAMPQAPPPKPVRVPTRTAEVPVNSRVNEGLLVLNAIPPPPDTLAKVPLGEARSLFAVAPGDTTIIADPAAGTKGGGASSKASGNGVPSDNPSGDTIADLASGGGTEAVSIGSGNGNGHEYGSGAGNGLNPSVAGAGTGRGAASGTGTGSGLATAFGSGTGAGSAPGGGGFPGISVSGGRYGNPASASIHTNVVTRTQRTYGMTIAATASSGGGLPDLGVFQNEKVYTVYLDMRAEDGDSTPSWILQYALLRPSDPSAVRIVGIPSPPYATLKQIPELPADLAAACAHRLIVLSAVMTPEGKLEHVSVKKSPDERVNALLTSAMMNWTFQPSQIEGNPVALKVLLGVRIGRH